MDTTQATFTNRFRYAINSHVQEVVISFSQQQPIWDDTTDEITSSNEFNVNNVVMSLSTAKDLAQKLVASIAEIEKAANESINSADDANN